MVPTELEKEIKYSFRNKGLLETALSHSSYTYENHGSTAGNERMEFLGDSILGLVIGEMLFKSDPEMREGVMSKTRAQIVCENSLSEVARSIGLGKFLKLGRGEKQSGGNKRDSNLANAVEALIAAVYLDAGFEEAKALILRLFSGIIASALKGELVYDHKSRILEHVQGLDRKADLRFVLFKEEGPVHDRVFHVRIQLDGKVLSEGCGQSKKEAEQDASRKALLVLNKKNRKHL